MMSFLAFQMASAQLELWCLPWGHFQLKSLNICLTAISHNCTICEKMISKSSKLFQISWTSKGQFFVVYKGLGAVDRLNLYILSRLRNCLKQRKNFIFISNHNMIFDIWNLCHQSFSFGCVSPEQQHDVRFNP